MFDHSKIDFKVEKFPLINQWPKEVGFGIPDIKSEEISSHIGVGLRRTDTKEPIGIVSDEYKPVQYMEIVSHVEKALTLVRSGHGRYRVYHQCP